MSSIESNQLASYHRTLTRHIRYLRGPVAGTRFTRAYARLVAREAYFWAWPMVNLYNRRLACADVLQPCLLDGVLPAAPLNSLAMLHDYIEPRQRMIACPDRDMIYGEGIAALEDTPVVIQVPNFGSRYWLYQLVDLRTDSFADIGAPYGTTPGFYLIVGPSWDGLLPHGITGVLRCSTNTALIMPHVELRDTPQDRAAVQDAIARIDMYPLDRYDGRTKKRDWHALPHRPARGPAYDDETSWVSPERFFDQLADVLEDAPALDGEEAHYSEILAVTAAARYDAALKQAMNDEAVRADRELIGPLLQFRDFGTPLPNHWTTHSNGGEFGTDYFMRTAIARSGILVQKSTETKYFHQDLDAAGNRLNGDGCYAIRFAHGEQPPARAFWSLTVYDAFHHLAPNARGRFSIGSRNDLVPDDDGAVTIYVQTDEPADPVQRANWLPAPEAQDFTLVLRACWPGAAILNGRWVPPAVVRVR
jgi:hypothetical protein